MIKQLRQTKGAVHLLLRDSCSHRGTKRLGSRLGHGRLCGGFTSTTYRVKAWAARTRLLKHDAALRHRPQSVRGEQLLDGVPLSRRAALGSVEPCDDLYCGADAFQLEPCRRKQVGDLRRRFQRAHESREHVSKVLDDIGGLA